MKPETTEIKPTGRKNPLRLLALLCALCLLLTGCAKVKKLAGEMYFIWMIDHGDDHLNGWFGIACYGYGQGVCLGGRVG